MKWIKEQKSQEKQKLEAELPLVTVDNRITELEQKSVEIPQKKKKGRKPKVTETLTDIWGKNNDISSIQNLKIFLFNNRFTKHLEQENYKWIRKTIELVALSEVLKDKKLIEKGNQSVIARAMCNEFAIPIDIQSFKLTREKRRQAELYKHLFNEFNPEEKYKKIQ